MPSAFICHSSRDKEFARRLARRLSDFGITVWIDEAEIKIGDSLIKKISDAIENTDYVLAILSPNSINSEWVQKELEMAMTKEIKGKKVVVLPLLLSACHLPAYLFDKVYADFRKPGDFESEIKKIIVSMRIQYTEPQPKAIKPSPHDAVGQGVKSEIRIPVQEFEDIAIVGIDKAGVSKVTESKALYRIPFILSAMPPVEWGQLFANEREFPRHTMWREARVEGDRIVVECGLDEVQRYHARDIKQDVENTNKKYREYLTEIALQKVRAIQRQQEEEMRIEKELGGIEF